MASRMENHTKALDRLYREQIEARQRNARDESEIRGQAGRPPAPGDLFVVARTAELGLEWALLEEETGEPRRFFAVPADVNPSAGSADVTVPREAPGGPLTLRCRFGAWLDAGELDPELRTGVLERHVLSQVRDKRRLLESATLAGTETEQEVDADPEYRRWSTEVLEPARAAFSRSPASLDESSGKVLAFPSPRPWHVGRSAYGLAASVLLVVALGLTSALAWQQRTVRSAERALEGAEQERASLEQERQRLEQVASGLQRDNERLERDYRQQIEDLETRISTRRSLGVDVNPPLVAFPIADTLRSQARRIAVSTNDRFLLLVFPLEDSRLRYRVEISRRDTGERVVSESGLESSAMSDLTLAVPTRLLVAGDYRIRLYVSNGDRHEPVAEYRLTLDES